MNEIVPGFLGTRIEGRPKVGWLSQAILSGFIASMAMMLAFALAYGAALALAGLLSGGTFDTASRTGVARWFSNLTHNPLTDFAQSAVYFTVGSHITLGMCFAGLYAYLAEPRMWGPHWARGLVFSAIPWLFSVVLFFPLAGAGFLGMGLGAGPLPFLGNLALHAVYGLVLGAIYGPWGDTLPSVDETHTKAHYMAMVGVEGMAARGVLFGLLIGLVAGAVGGPLAAGQLPDLTSVPAQLSVLGTALMGGAFGALVGSFFGLPAERTGPADTSR